MKQILSLLLILSIAACHSPESGSLAYEAAVDNFEELAEVPKEVASTPKELLQDDRKLIKTAHLQFETKDLKQTASTLRKLSSQYAGFISDEQLEERSGSHWSQVQIKVPSQHFDALLVSISGQVEKFDRMEVSSQDVTEEYTDLQARIATKKKVEQRYLEILSKAKTIEEILKVERELGSIREGIERAEGRIRYLSTRASMSTMNVSYYEVVPVSALKEQPGFLTNLVDALENGVDLLKGLAIGLASIWPLLLIIGSVILVFRKRFKKAAVSA